jgi:outer membrane lipoprotein SlyB
VVKKALPLVVLLLAACAGDGAYRTEPLPVEPERSGVIEELRSVPLPSRGGSIAGTVVGGAAGGAAGSAVGSGRGSQAASVAGSVAGSIVGYTLGEGIGKREGLEITLRLDNGRQLIVVQPDGERFAVGERVRVINEKQGLRVAH